MTEIPGLEWYLSVGVGPGNANAQPDPNAALGGWISRTKPAEPVTLHNLFPDVTQLEATKGVTQHRVLFLRNSSGRSFGVRVFLAHQVPWGAAVSIGMDPAGSVPLAQAGAQSVQVGNQEDVPGGVTFAAPTTPGTGLDLGVLADGEVFAIHVRRHVVPGTNEVRNDGCALRAEVI